MESSLNLMRLWTRLHALEVFFLPPPSAHRCSRRCFAAVMIAVQLMLDWLCDIHWWEMKWSTQLLFTREFSQDNLLSNGSMPRPEKSCGSESSINYFHCLLCYLRGMRNHQELALHQVAYLQKPGLRFTKLCCQELSLSPEAGTKRLTPASKKVPKTSAREMKH